ncbi:hypothetical protein Val02_37430 [Virgisporangium aliadipatigenens]|uniref:Uncharacterized protein n=1 Tax=Virgisporangium aliadipatigenens TaxID=741659 RepID=A0A8J4DS24_9ACTN|nr:hypothetical protein Val02_37430 [Virgisporangium aliadipatigenens]
MEDPALQRVQCHVQLAEDPPGAAAMDTEKEIGAVASGSLPGRATWREEYSGSPRYRPGVERDGAPGSRR